MRFHSILGTLAVVVAVPLVLSGPSSAQPTFNETDRFDLGTETDVPYRTDTFTVRVGGLTENFGALEYKITMHEGDIAVYTWTAPIEIFYETHGHPPIDPDAQNLDVTYYGRGHATTRSGSFQAAMDGIHGWYFANPDFEAIEIEITLAGFYELEPGVISMAPILTPEEQAAQDAELEAALEALAAEEAAAQQQ